jgi:hypothetical protein
MCYNTKYKFQQILQNGHTVIYTLSVVQLLHS